VNFGGQNIDNDVFPNFFGTSAAAPHIAAAAALLIEGKKKFQNITITPSDIRTLLQLSAKDMGDPGFDAVTGPGFIQIDSTFKTFARPKPVIHSIGPLELNKTPGIDAITLVVKGDYMMPGTKIYFNNSEITTTLLNEKEARASLNTFTGNPGVKLYTPPMVANGLDGGFSATKYFGGDKTIVHVKADDKSKKYGESVPEFTDAPRARR
ncbi:MAG: S8 family serine peptidase, partial [Fuerstia sp.]|nr:S8 family serine peptidase [Fuerstiella sp.]